MYKLAVLLLALFLFAGCKDDDYSDYEPPVCNGCLDDGGMTHDYVVSLSFVDHKGDTQTWPYTVTHSSSPRFFKTWPTVVYQTIGMLPTGKEEYWYSWIEPTRRKDGMLKIRCVDGSPAVCDFTSIRIHTVEAKAAPLDEAANSTIYEWKEMELREELCPKHGFGSGYGRR